MRRPEKNRRGEDIRDNKAVKRENMVGLLSK